MFLITHWRNAVAMGKRAGEMRLVGEAGCGGDLCGGHTASEKTFGSPQADRHQHLVRRDVEMRFKLALKMPGTQRCNPRQLVERDRMHIIIVQILAYSFKAMRPLRQYWCMAGQRLKRVDQIEQ